MTIAEAVLAFEKRKAAMLGVPITDRSGVREETSTADAQSLMVGLDVDLDEFLPVAQAQVMMHIRLVTGPWDAEPVLRMLALEFFVAGILYERGS